jgi:flagellar protein FlaG
MAESLSRLSLATTHQLLTPPPATLRSRSSASEARERETLQSVTQDGVFENTAGGEALTQSTIDRDVAHANAVAQSLDKKINFSFNKDLNQIIVKVIENSSEEILIQIPPEALVNLRTNIKEQVENFRGLLLDRREV